MVRLHKFLAHAGIASRRKCEELVAAGHVTVDGELVTRMGVLVDPEIQEVRYDGRLVRPERTIHFLFHKPAGMLSTSAPDETRPRVVDVFARFGLRLYTAGRLDMASEGLILVTNDGALAERVTHPRHGVPKCYAVRCRGRIDAEAINRLREGIWLSEGKTSPAKVEVQRLGRDTSSLVVTIFEGRNREIRRTFARCGFPVQSLKRVRIGGLGIAGLPRGRFRQLGPDEVAKLLQTGAVEPQRPGKTRTRTRARGGKPRRGGRKMGVKR